MPFRIIIIALACSIFVSCGSAAKKAIAQQPPDTVQTAIGPLVLPPPYATKSAVHFSNIVGWKDGRKPIAPQGFEVIKLAADFQNPRWAYVGPNGDIFISEGDKRNSANRITLLRQLPNGKLLRTVFLKDLTQPFGMLILNGYFYVANMNGVVRYPYIIGDTVLTTGSQNVLELPVGGYNNHWTRNIIAAPDGKHIYVSVGSASNAGEHGMAEEVRRACILEALPDGSQSHEYATGLRNPVGMDFAPGTNTLWTAVNERDELGNDLVPDYLTSVQPGGFYGWPFSYYGQLPDPRWKDDPHTDLVNKAVVPDVPLGSHTASLGLTFYTKPQFGAAYQGGAFIGQHGSWNRSDFAGYKVVFVPFKNGKPQAPQDFLTGFIDTKDNNDVYGRPVGVAQTADGSLIVIDDASDIVWLVRKMQ